MAPKDSPVKRRRVIAHPECNVRSCLIKEVAGHIILPIFGREHQRCPSDLIGRINRHFGLLYQPYRRIQLAIASAPHQRCTTELVDRVPGLPTLLSECTCPSHVSYCARTNASSIFQLRVWCSPVAFEDTQRSFRRRRCTVVIPSHANRGKSGQGGRLPVVKRLVASSHDVLLLAHAASCAFPLPYLHELRNVKTLELHIGWKAKPVLYGQ
eukprot:scaffold109322_cov30-Tisochrysis_lutea.AAC.4